MATFELNQRIVKKDFGEITIYIRADHAEQNQLPRYYARIKIKGSKGYKKFSTRETSQELALLRAEERYKELLLLQERTGSINYKSFRAVMNEWAEHRRSDTDTDKKLIDEYVEKLDRYAVPFFKRFTGIGEIREANLQEWIDYRRTQFVRSKPRNTTIARELTGIKQVFEFAVARDYLTTRLKFPIVSITPNPRPFFNLNQYRALYRGLRKLTNSVAHHKANHRARFYLQHYVLVLANSGIRIGEARNLLWEDIVPRTDGKGILLYVRGKTKKRRQVVPQPAITRVIDRIKDYRTIELGCSPPDKEPVFCSTDGKTIGSYKKGFKTALKSIDLEVDDEGNPFTLYSLRHTYATFRINNRAPLYFVANNMGTSPEMLIKFYSHATNEANADEITQMIR